MIVYLRDEQNIASVCLVISIYIIQAWADLRCLSFLERQCESLIVGDKQRARFPTLLFCNLITLYIEQG